MSTIDIYLGPMPGAIGIVCRTRIPAEKCLVHASGNVRTVWRLSQNAMLAGSQIEILRDTEKYLTERVVEGTRAVHPSESRASRRPGRAIAGGAEHVIFTWQVGLTGHVTLFLNTPRHRFFKHATSPFFLTPNLDSQ